MGWVCCGGAKIFVSWCFAICPFRLTDDRLGSGWLATVHRPCLFPVRAPKRLSFTTDFKFLQCIEVPFLLQCNRFIRSWRNSRRVCSGVWCQNFIILMRMLNWWLLCWRGSRTLTLVISNRKAIDGNCASNYGQEVHACLFSVWCHNSNCCPHPLGWQNFSLKERPFPLIVRQDLH
jgi:hypothetical protein